MFVSNAIGIVADDLTGANDSALQFHLRGCNTQILLSPDSPIDSLEHTQAWAISTETRNASPKVSYEKVKLATKNLLEKLNVEYFYKKIDSTLRGNIAVEVLTMLDVLDWDAAVVIPAYPNEGRITVGGYHLLRGVPIERTEMARDIHSPIFDSYIPTIFKKQLDEQYGDLIDLIDLDTVIKGAGPILVKLNELVQEGKKLIVVDAVSTTDIEQIILATEKSHYKILPCGSAGAAQAIGKIWFPELKNQNISKKIPILPKLVISGSATELSASQIKKLEQDDDIENTYFVSLKLDDVLSDVKRDIVDRIVGNLIKNNIVVVHASEISLSKDFNAILVEKELTKERFSTVLVNYLAKLTQMVVSQKEVVLITIGGETSFKCCRALDSENLQLIDSIAPAIALCIDHKGQWIVTKSGNLGNLNTLVDIVKYFESHE